MKVVLQKAKNAKVTVNNKMVGTIDYGLMILVGITHEDNIMDAKYMVDKIVNLRIFDDEEGKMNLSLIDIGGSLLSISQFTLYGDVRKGRRPNFTSAARPEQAEELYNKLNDLIREKGVIVETGSFGKMMDVDFVNEGPVTIILDSKER